MASPALRVLFVTPYFAPAWGYGGPPRVVYDLSRALVRLGHGVTVLTTDALDERRARAGEETIEGVRVLRHRNLSNALAWRRKRFAPPGLVAAALREARCADVVHVTEARTVAAAAGFLAARAARKPLALSPFGTLASRGGALRHGYDATFVRPMVRAAALLLAQTSHEEDALIAAGGSRDAIVSLPLPVDLESVAVPAKDEARRVLGLGLEDDLVLAVARIHDLKGLDVLLDAVVLARTRAPRLRALVIGRDDGALAALRRRYPGDVVEFRPPLYEGRRFDAYAACDVFALTPRFWEETSLAAVEAAACGRPVVLTPQAQIPGLEAAGGGAPPAAEPAAVADALVFALADRERLGVAARALVERQHALPGVAAELARAYGSVSARTT